MTLSKLSTIATEATALTGAEKLEILQGGATKVAPYSLLRAESNFTLKKIQTLGSVALGVTFDPYFATATQTLVDGRQYMVPFYLPKAETITGVKFVQVTQGNYTADNNNRIGLYSVVAGVLTLQASCANNGDLWKSAGGIITVAFDAPYAASAGVYYIGYLYNQSAQVTAPSIAAHLTLQANVSFLDMANSNALSCYIATANLAASTTALSSFAVAASSAFFIIY
jgi:hypothetical protein